MNKTILIIIVISILILVIGGYFLLRERYYEPRSTPTPAPEFQVQIKEGSLEEVQTKFIGTILADWPEYQKDPLGFYATRADLLEDRIVDPLNPETLLIDREDNIVGIKYMVQSDTRPTLFGVQFETTPPEGHHGFEVPHWDLHLWLIDNPFGAFAAFVLGTEYSFNPASITVSAGEKVKVVFRNDGEVPHNLAIEGLAISTKTISSGQTDTIEFTAPVSGNYTFFCSVSGHRAAGMEGSLIVE